MFVCFYVSAHTIGQMVMVDMHACMNECTYIDVSEFTLHAQYWIGAGLIAHTFRAGRRDTQLQFRTVWSAQQSRAKWRSQSALPV